MVTERTSEQLVTEGMQALRTALGLAGTVRFLQLVSSGEGDWARDRHDVLAGETFEGVVAELRRDLGPAGGA